MNRRRFLASTSIVLADSLLSRDLLNASATENVVLALPGHTFKVIAIAVDFVANNPGDILLHCHQALHMDFGFMQLMKYAG